MIVKIVRFFGDEKFARWRRRALLATLLIVFAADFLVERGHGEFFWDDIAGWWAVFGFLSCVVIILVSKALGHQGRLMRDENYYDRDYDD